MQQQEGQAGAAPVQPHVIQVSSRQKGNPILASVRNVPWAYVPAPSVKPDYILGTSTCALFISVRYHLLHPTYLIRRIRELGQDFRLRVVLALVDVDDSTNPLQEINKMCLLHDCTLILAFSPQEAGRYLETFKLYEKKPASSIQERTEKDFLSRMTSTLTSVRSVNKTDVVTMLENFGSLGSICKATEEQLVLCPGLGDKKVKRLFSALHEPFFSNKHNKKTKESAHIEARSSSGISAITVVDEDSPPQHEQAVSSTDLQPNTSAANAATGDGDGDGDGDDELAESAAFDIVDLLHDDDEDDNSEFGDDL